MLPEKWCIKTTDSNKDAILKWLNEGIKNAPGYKRPYPNLNNCTYIHYPNLSNGRGFRDGYHKFSVIQYRYSEISSEDFEEYVLNNTISTQINYPIY